MEKFTLNSIGKIVVCDNQIIIELDEKYIVALVGLDEFSYIQVLWWFSGSDNEHSRSKLTVNKPYKNGLDVLGVFTTRSSECPNPIALTCSYITYIDYENDIIGLGYIDANDGGPVLDIKPYIPSLDRVENEMPKWCKHWPKCIEELGDFDWESEFNF